MRTRSSLPGGCLSLFGLPFLAVGLFMTGLVIHTLREADRMAGWEELPATILETDLESHRDSDGDVTHRVRVRYRYHYVEQTYEGDRVGLHGGSDNIGSYHRDWHKRLQAALAGGTTVPCFVNPVRPAEAVLDRRPRGGMLAFQGLFGAVFGLAGLGLVLGGLFGSRASRQLKRAQQQHPEEPWKWRADWSSGVLRPASGAGAWALLVMATVWNLISWPAALFMMPKAVREGQYAALFIVIFPLIGLALVVAAVTGIRRWRRFREATLHLQAVPLRPGGELVAGLRLPERLQPREGVRLTVRCARTEVRGAGKRRRVTTVDLWKDERTEAQHRSRDPGSSLWAVHFQLPADLPPADLATGHGHIGWRLEASAQVEGPDLDLTFDLPVFGPAVPPPVPAAGPETPLPP